MKAPRSELTGGYGLLAPMMIATVVAYAASSLNSSIFKSQVATRRESPVHRGEYDNSVLRELKVRDASSPQFLFVESFTSVGEVLDIMKASTVDTVFFGERLPEANGKVRVASLNDMLVAHEAGRTALAAARSQEAPVISDTDSLYDAFNLLMSAGAEIIAVSRKGAIVGKISYKDIARAYHHQIHARMQK